MDELSYIMDELSYIMDELCLTPATAFTTY